VKKEKPLMRFSSFPRLLFLAISSSFLFSCNEKEELVTESLTDYMPLAAGKYITYRLDSLVFTNFGRTTEIHKYQVKHQVDALITDNLGRPAYRVFRFIRDSAGLQPWQPNGSYFITALADQVEISDDNLRMIKLHLPIIAGRATVTCHWILMVRCLISAMTIICRTGIISMMVPPAVFPIRGKITVMY
jgi:hypothetical protein